MDATALSKRSTSGTLSKYDPRKGVKHIAGADAAVKHFAMAKDASNLERAIRRSLKRKPTLWCSVGFTREKQGWTSR